MKRISTELKREIKTLDITGYVEIDEINTRIGKIFLVKVAGLNWAVLFTREDAEKEAKRLRNVVCAVLHKYIKEG